MATTTYVNKRTRHRWRLLALMLVGVFFAFGSFWLVQVMRGGDDVHNVNVGNDPDYIIDNFSFVRMTEAGQPRYVISGERLTHRPANNTSIIDKPVVQSMSTDHPRMTITADNAHVNQEHHPPRQQDHAAAAHPHRGADPAAGRGHREDRQADQDDAGRFFRQRRRHGRQQCHAAADTRRARPDRFAAAST
jgi:lipopolysaccharide export system protein LptC